MEFDAVIVGAGPNGLAAAIEVARAGYRVCVLEARDTVGGGTRTAELTSPGFLHDVCSAVHPLGIASPFFRTLPLAAHGVEWIHSPACLAHPFDDGPAAMLFRSMAATGATLGVDASSWEKRFSPFVRNIDKVLPEILGPPIHLSRHPLLMLYFAIQALQPANRLAARGFKDGRARALFSGIAGHSNMPLDQSPTAAFGLLLGMLGHVRGWPIVKGGSENLARALAAYLLSLGGKIETGVRIKAIRELPASRVVFFDLTPKQILNLAFDQLPPAYRWELEKYRYGSAVFKVDWALNSPIPWRPQECLKAATVHVCGSAEEIADAERLVAKGQCPERPFVLLSQPSLFDETRAPKGMHTAWAYCHVPANSKIDMTSRIESQIERFAPGFRDCIVARHVMNPSELETYNANYVGGDIGGGVQNILQTFGRPSFRLTPYAIPVKGMFICSSSTPPGGGVHGMCGYHAARAALSTILYNPSKGGGSP